MAMTPRLTLCLLLVALIHSAGLFVAPVVGAPSWSRAEGRQLFEGAVVCASPDLPNPCFNSDGSAYVCCGPQSCPSAPTSEARCAGSAVGTPQSSPSTCDPLSSLPNQCFDAPGQTFICCPGQCGNNAPGSPTCAPPNNNAAPPPVGNMAQPPPPSTASNDDQCSSDSSRPNQCFNADGSAFTCCPGECGNPPKAVPYCKGSAVGNLPDGHLYPIPATLGTVPADEEADDNVDSDVDSEPVPPITEPVPYGAANLPPLTPFDAFPAGQSFPVLSEDEALQLDLARFYDADPSQGSRKRSLLATNSVVDVKVTFVVIRNDAGEGDVSDALLLEVVNRINVFYQDMPFRFSPHVALRVKSKADYILTSADPNEPFCAFKTKWRRGTAQDLFIYIVQSLSRNGTDLNGIASFPKDLSKSGRGIQCDGVIVIQDRIPGYSAIMSNGDTFPHEIGHWLQLQHTFLAPPAVGKTGCDGVGDDVSDTPPQKDKNYGDTGTQAKRAQCRRPIFRCPGADVDAEPYWNVMSYGACREWFTPGQAKKALEGWNNHRKGKTTAVTPPRDLSGNTRISETNFPLGTSRPATVTVEINGNSEIGLMNKPPADVVFVLDVSGSVNDASFIQERNFTVRAITSLSNGGLFFNGGTISIIQFGRNVRVILERASYAAYALGVASTMTRFETNGTTATGNALQKARDTLDEGPTGGTKVIVLITDGVNNTGVDPERVARSAKAAGVTIIGIGVGRELTKANIIPWVGRSTESPDEYYFAVSDFFALASQLGAVLSRAFPPAQDIVIRGTVDAKFPAISSGPVVLTGTVMSPTDHSFEWSILTLPARSNLQLRFSINVPCTTLPEGQYSVFESLTWEDSANQTVVFPPLNVRCV